MSKVIPIITGLFITWLYCQQSNRSENEPHNQINQISHFKNIINKNGTNIKSRFILSENYNRIEYNLNTFGYYLQNLSLKPHNSDVLLFNGNTKFRNVHAAVLNIDVGNKDLQQCADAIMRLRGEYLYANGFYDQIQFNLTNGFLVDYSKWMEGYRVKVSGNHTEWTKSRTQSNTYAGFRKYMDFIFTYAGTLSLSKELSPVSISDLQIGDIFIHGGSPGHAIIVVDVAIHKDTGGKIFLLAQSYMPAQDIHILKNLNDTELSPWYEDNFGEKLHTPEWTFEAIDLKRF